MNITKWKSTLGALFALVVAESPQIIGWLAGLQSQQVPNWVKHTAAWLGVLIGVLTSKRGVAILNLFIPSATRSTDATTSSGSQIRPMPPGSTAAAIIVLALGSLLFAGSAQAQTPAPTPSDVAPPLSFCIGTGFTCVVPDVGLKNINYDLKAKQWAGGITGVAAGYALLFASDKPYASGVAIHASFDFSQTVPSYFAPTFSLVAFHWFEAGYTPVFMNGQIGQQLTLGVNLNAEAIASLFTGQNISQRLTTAKAFARATQKLNAEQAGK